MKVESVRRSVEGISELIQEMAEEEGNTGEQRLDMGVLLALVCFLCLPFILFVVPIVIFFLHLD